LFFFGKYPKLIGVSLRASIGVYSIPGTHRPRTFVGGHIGQGHIVTASRELYLSPRGRLAIAIRKIPSCLEHIFKILPYHPAKHPRSQRPLWSLRNSRSMTNFWQKKLREKKRLLRLFGGVQGSRLKLPLKALTCAKG
jgi:hypothetical protein